MGLWSELSALRVDQVMLLYIVYMHSHFMPYRLPSFPKTEQIGTTKRKVPFQRVLGKMTFHRPVLNNVSRNVINNNNNNGYF